MRRPLAIAAAFVLLALPLRADLTDGNRRCVEDPPEATSPVPKFAAAIAIVSDFDADGRPEVATVVSRPHAVEVLILSGSDGSRIASFPAVQGLNLREPSLCFLPSSKQPRGYLAVSAREIDLIEVYSLASFEAVARIEAAPGEGWLGREMAAVGDIDGDGASEMLFEAEPVVPSVAGSRLRYGLYSTAERKRTRKIPGPAHKERCSRGSGLGPVGDVDRDGAPDYAVRSGAHAITIHSGRSGDPVRTIEGDGKEQFCFGHGMVSLGDVDGDRSEDTVVVSLPVGPGEVRGRFQVYSGKDGKLLHDVRPALILEEVGSAFAIAPDLDGDGALDLALSGYGIGSIAMPGGVAVVSSKTGALLSQAKDSIYTIWSIASEQGRSPFLVCNRYDPHYELASDRAVMAFDMRTGEQLWEVTAGSIAGKEADRR